MDRVMSFQMCDRLDEIFDGPPSLGYFELKIRKIYEKWPKPSRYFYPKTAQLDFVDLFVGNLGELLVEAKAYTSIHYLKFDILRLQRKLQEVGWLLKGIPELVKEEAKVNYNITNIANLAYEAEYVINSFLLGDIAVCYSMLWLREILEDIEGIIRRINGGFDIAESVARNFLNVDPTKLEMIPILNKNYYSSASVSSASAFFDVFKRMCDQEDVFTISSVSSYKKRKKEVLVELLRNVSRSVLREPEEIGYTSDMVEAELEESVRNLLQNKSYFIILEGVRDIHVLNDIKRFLPKDGHKLKVVLFTTASQELVDQCRHGFHPTSQIDKPTIKNDVVGFVEETKNMFEQLIQGPKKLHVISIVGMAGQGKTTLANKVFNDPLVKDYFDTRAWCYISQVYETRQILLELLAQVGQLSNRDHLKDDADLAEMLYKQLKGRRFLICLDDIWEIDAWNDLRRCFADDNNGSRVIFTTRIQGLAFQAKSNSMVQSLSLLSDDESWKLLEKKLFGKESCPTELVNIGRQIATSCKGLPLSVVLTAGLLVKVEKRVNQWKEIAESLCSAILNNVEAQGKVVIELSYKHLPNHLKPCFLYFGTFLEDKEVIVARLIRLWIAEGFVKHSDLKSLEDVAKDYFTDLTRRSIVTIAQEKSCGGVKSCRVHDLLLEFCLTKAKEENFLQRIDGHDKDMDLSDSSSSIGEKHHIHRLCMYPKRNPFAMLKPYGPFVRSLLFIASDMGPINSYDISYIFQNFKFLKILNLEGINIGDSLNDIGNLILLRYLACHSFVDLIPSSIAKLCNLQYFLFKGLGSKVVKVSNLIWDMKKLRHVHINDSASFELDPNRIKNSFTLDNLQSFSTPSLAYGDDMERMMRKLLGIRKLKCIFLDSWNEATNCNQFPVLGFLGQLVSLNAFYNGKGKYPCQFNFPANLKKLTLSNFRMPWNEISQLTTLCNLGVLKLLCNAFDGDKWEMEDVVFSKLKFLKSDTLNVEMWMASRDNFPCLESLLLHNCGQLQKIPEDIGEIPTLLMIEVLWCSPLAAASAKEIQDEQQDFNVELKVNILPKVWDAEVPSSANK